MIRTTLALLAVLGIFPASPPCRAFEKAPQEKPEKTLEKFYVYGGGCSRSIRLQGTYEDIRQAWEAAEKLRNKDMMKWVSVRTGAHDRDYFGTAATQYKVYEILCKGGGMLHATVESADKAKAIADKLKGEGNPIEIVLRYAAK